MKRIVSLAVVLGAAFATSVGILAIEPPPVTSSTSSAAGLAQNRNSITGFVFNESRSPLPDVYVELLSDMGTPLTRVKTSGAGTFTFRGLGDGVYTVKVLPYGKSYQGDEKRVSLISFGARPGFGAISEQVDFYLKARRASSNPLGPPGVVFVQEVPDRAKTLYEEGIVLLDDKRENEGFAKLRAAIETFPNYFAALDRLGGEYVVRQHYRPAFVLLTKAVEVNPKSFSSWLGLGLSQFRIQQYDDALTSLKRANELQPDSVNGLLWYGIALHAKGKYPEAETALEKADQIGKHDVAEVMWQLAKVYKDQGRYAEAAAQLEMLLQKKPKLANAEEVRKTIELLKQKKPQGT